MPTEPEPDRAAEETLLLARIGAGDRGALPLSYAVLVVLASSFHLREYAIAVGGAEVVGVATEAIG